MLAQFKESFSAENSALFLSKYKKHVALALIALFVILLSIISINFFGTKKKAMLSANLAIGFMELEEKSPDRALYYFEQVFNKTDGTYKLIAGIGVMQALDKKPGFEDKVLNVLSILQNYSSNKTFKLLLLSVYFSKIEGSDKEFKKFESLALKSDNLLVKEQLASIYLNKKEIAKFEKIIADIKKSLPKTIGDEKTENLQKRVSLL